MRFKVAILLGISLLALSRIGTAQTAVSINGSVTVAGPSPWYDITAPGFGAKCDGASDDTAAIQAAITAANSNGGGIVYTPPNIRAACIVASPLSCNGCNNVWIMGTQPTGNGNGATVRPVWQFTGSSGPLLSLKSTNQMKISGMVLQYTNAAFNGLLIDLEHNDSSNVDSQNDIFQDDTLGGTSTANQASCLLSGDKADAITIRNNFFGSAVNAICGTASSSSYAVNWRIEDNYFGDPTPLGPSTLSGTAIVNPHTQWVIIGNNFEVGSNLIMVDETNSPLPLGFSWISNVVDDIAPGWAGPVFKNFQCAGAFITGSGFVGTSTATFAKFAASANGCTFTGNEFNTWGTVFDVSAGNVGSLTVTGNLWGIGITRFMKGSLTAAGNSYIGDNTGVTTIYGPVKVNNGSLTISGTPGFGSTGVDSTTSYIGIDSNANGRGYGDYVHLTDAVTWNLCTGGDTSGNFDIRSGCFPGAAGISRFKILTGGGAQFPEQSAPSESSGNDVCYGDSTAHALKCSYNSGAFRSLPQVIASGTAAMTTAAIPPGACGSTVTVAAFQVSTTDAIEVSSNSPAIIPNGLLILNKWPAPGNVNFAYCNPTGSSQTPTAATINWAVHR